MGIPAVTKKLAETVSRLAAALLVASLFVAFTGIAPNERVEAPSSSSPSSDNRPYLVIPKRDARTGGVCGPFRESSCAAESCEPTDRSCIHLCCHRHCESQCDFGDPRAKSCHDGCEKWRDGDEPFRR